jgi:CRP-like cAMP-binding protein
MRTAGFASRIDNAVQGKWATPLISAVNNADIPRTATIRTLQACRMLTLREQEFKKMVREYPQIALGICKVLGARIRKLHTRMTH